MLEIAVTNRYLCKDDYFTQIAKVASHKPYAILLREKDLDYDKYVALSSKVKRICDEAGTRMIAHTHASPAFDSLHVPFALASEQLAREFALSVSVHSAEEAIKAEAIGAKLVIAGHIFETGCKPGLSPRGLAFLEEICRAVRIPVFAIGGIRAENMQLCAAAGAAGVCRMSYWMEL